MHMVSVSTEKQISAEAMESKKKDVEGQEPITLSDKMKCFACKKTSHTLDQCSIKETLVTMAHQFGHCTRVPFYMVRPSEEVVEKEKFYHHCLLITSNINNLDLIKVKFEVNKFWKLINDWEIRREGQHNFLASFNSEDDLTTCLKLPRMETYVDDKEVIFTVARWKEDDNENLELVREWFLVYGVPRIYRNWKELYQVASAVGVLVEVDEESLEGGDKEPIRLKVGLISLVGAAFSCHFMFGWYSRMVTFIIEGKVHRIGQVLQEQKVEDHLDGVNKEYENKTNKSMEIPPEIADKGMNSESTICSPDIAASTGNHVSDFEGCSEIADKGMNLESTICSTDIVALTGNHVLDFEGCSDHEQKKESNSIEATLLEEPESVQELRICGEIKNKEPEIVEELRDYGEIKNKEPEIVEELRDYGEIENKENNVIGPAATMNNYNKTNNTMEIPPEILDQGADSESSICSTNNVASLTRNHVLDFEGCLEIVDKGTNSESIICSTDIVASTVNHVLEFEDCSDKEHKREVDSIEPTLLEQHESVEELSVCREIYNKEPDIVKELRIYEEIKNKENNESGPTATATNYKKTAKAGGEKSISGNSTSMTGEAPSTGNHVLEFESRSDKEHKREGESIEPTLLEEPESVEELSVCGEIKKEEPDIVEESRVYGEIKNKENDLSGPTATATNYKETAKAGGEKSINGNSTSMPGEAPSQGRPQPLIKLVYARRGRDKIQKKPTEKQGSSDKLKTKEMNPESCSHATFVAAPTGQNRLDSVNCIEKECDKEVKTAEIAVVREGQKSVQVSDGEKENKDSNGRAPSATAIKSKKNQTREDTMKAEGGQSISNKKGSDGTQFDAKKHVSEMNTLLTRISEEFSTHNEIYESFDGMDLQDNLLKGIYAYGMDKPSPVHQRGIVPLCKGLDIIQESLSGATVTLCCGVLQRLDYSSTECQALVLVPTRDLAEETRKVIEALGHCLGVKAHACFGGTSAREDQQIMSSGVQVIVGTPGCVLDMLRRQALCPDHIRMLILDEADEVLRGAFKDKIHDILGLLPTKIQVGVFSATMSHEALEICRKFMNKPVTITVPRDEELKGINIRQFYVNVDKEECKLDKLCHLFDTISVTQGIIFVNTRRKVKSLTEKIRSKGYTVSGSHGGMEQQARDVAVQEFRSGSSRVLIATDLRGTDLLHVPVVINYDLPTQPENYLRHVQRSGQHGKKGVAISFVTRTDQRVFSSIQRFPNAEIEELPSNVADLF